MGVYLRISQVYTCGNVGTTTFAKITNRTKTKLHSAIAKEYMVVSSRTVLIMYGIPY